MRGTMTCAKRTGSIGHEYQDARQYANWGVDYLKEDWCNTLPGQNTDRRILMRDALKDSGRPILFSICEWGSTKPWLWAGGMGICGGLQAIFRIVGVARRPGVAMAWCRLWI